jgi:hypothetical protein
MNSISTHDENLRLLRDIWNETGSRGFGSKLKSHRILFEWLFDATSDIKDILTLRERAFIVLNNPSLICQHGNRKKFVPAQSEMGFCGSVRDCQCHADAFKNMAQATHDHRTPEDRCLIYQKQRDTNITRYGVGNASQIPEAKIKRKQTIAARFGKDPLYQYEEWRLKWYDGVISRLADFVTPLFSREDWRGVTRQYYEWKCRSCDHVFVDNCNNGRIPKCGVCYPKTTSVGQNQLYEFISNLLPHDVILQNDRSLLQNFELDILIPEKKIAIEYNGLYWHSEKFRDSKYHINKLEECQKQGVTLIQIFEDTWLNKPKLVMSRLRHQLKSENSRIFARKCECVELESKQGSDFLNDHHLSGSIPASKYIGLKFGETLVMVMSLGKPRYSGEQWEILRMASHGSVIGGASKLFNYFVKLESPNSVVTYADRCWGEGKVYQTLGFVFDSNTGPGYWYVSGVQRKHRSHFTKVKLVSMGFSSDLTESEIMKSQKWLKIWDCGNAKYIWTK